MKVWWRSPCLSMKPHCRHAPLWKTVRYSSGEECRKDREDAKPGRGESAGWLLAAPVSPECFLWAGAGRGGGGTQRGVCDRIWP